MENMTISEQTEIWLQLYSRTNQLAQDIFRTIRDEQGEKDGDTEKTEDLFAPIGKGLNDAAKIIFERVTCAISSNLSEGGHII